MVDRKPPESDCLNNLEEDFRREQASSGYESGLVLGRKAGLDEGFSQGMIEGAKIGSEVGFYRGYTMTWIQLLQSDSTTDTKSTKVLNKLNEILELVDAFPKTNETLCEEKLSKIRVKFKQSTSLLNIKL